MLLFMMFVRHLEGHIFSRKRLNLSFVIALLVLCKMYWVWYADTGCVIYVLDGILFLKIEYSFL